jgi:uncharacterized protein (TIGR02246 family)
MNPQTQQAYINTRDSEPVRFLGIPTVMRSTGETTNGAFALIEHLTTPPGFASPYHTHHFEDEAFYILEGELAFVCNGQWFQAGAGSYVFGPRNIPHGFKVVGNGPAKILILCAPAGFERFVLEMSEPTAAPSAPPDMGKLMALAEKYGIEIHGPLPEQPDGSGNQPARSDREWIDSVREAHVAAINSRDAAALAALFTEDALQMPPNAPSNAGRANIESWARAFLRAFEVQFSLSVMELEIADSRAVEIGAYEITLIPDAGGARIEDRGKYITIYRRLPEGGWGVVRDIWNSDQPAPAR